MLHRPLNDKVAEAPRRQAKQVWDGVVVRLDPGVGDADDAEQRA
jgi:hypothetical protein